MSARPNYDKWERRLNSGELGENPIDPSTWVKDDLWALAADEFAGGQLQRPLSDRERGRAPSMAPLGPRLVTEDERPRDPTEPPATPQELARQQVADAIARGRLDLTSAPRWPFADLDDLMGPMIPGDLPIVAAVTGNGKSTFLRSAIDGWAARECSSLYVPLETGAVDIRRDWAAWRLNLDPVKVARNEWAKLGEGAQDAHEAMVEELGRCPYIHFATPTYITIAKLDRWIRWSVRELGVRHVVIDHVQRMDHHNPHMARHLMVHEAVRRLKDISAELGIQVILAAQIKQVPDRLDVFYPPPTARLKDSSGIAEEATDILVLSRRFRADATKADKDAVRAGEQEEWTVTERGTMVVTCRKKRLDDSARDRRVYLRVESGRIDTSIRRPAPDRRDYSSEGGLL